VDVASKMANNEISCHVRDSDPFATKTSDLPHILIPEFHSAEKVASVPRRKDFAQSYPMMPESSSIVPDSHLPHGIFVNHKGNYARISQGCHTCEPPPQTTPSSSRNRSELENGNATPSRIVQVPTEVAGAHAVESKVDPPFTYSNYSSNIEFTECNNINISQSISDRIPPDVKSTHRGGFQLNLRGRPTELRGIVKNQGPYTAWTTVSNQSFRRRKKVLDEYRKSVVRRSRDSLLCKLTLLILETYATSDPKFCYTQRNNPRRVLTKPSKASRNEGFDNEDNDYILHVNDVLGDDPDRQYLVIDVLGQGTFGQVVKCQNLFNGEIVAVKVVKNKPAYFNQSLMEVNILELLNRRFDTNDSRHIIRMKDSFVFRRHLCLVFEQLSINLYELIKQNQFRGVTVNLVRVFTSQILDALTCLSDAKIIHCDLKPENILLRDLHETTIKVIDFGSACQEHQTVYTYIQSRFYRSPEVLLGLPYSNSIDIWSLGCIVAELFLGLPIFPGSSEYNQISRIIEMLGMPPSYMIEVGKSAKAFFVRVDSAHPAGPSGRKPKHIYRLKSRDQYSKEFNLTEQPSKRYFSGTTLKEVIMQYPLSRKLGAEEMEAEMRSRECLIDFIQGILNLNPIERWSAAQARGHPFITGVRFDGPWTPNMGILFKQFDPNHAMHMEGVRKPQKTTSDAELQYFPARITEGTHESKELVSRENSVTLDLNLVRQRARTISSVAVELNQLTSQGGENGENNEVWYPRNQGFDVRNFDIGTSFTGDKSQELPKTSPLINPRIRKGMSFGGGSINGSGQPKDANGPEGPFSSELQSQGDIAQEGLNFAKKGRSLSISVGLAPGSSMYDASYCNKPWAVAANMVAPSNLQLQTLNPSEISHSPHLRPPLFSRYHNTERLKILTQNAESRSSPHLSGTSNLSRMQMETSGSAIFPTATPRSTAGQNISSMSGLPTWNPRTRVIPSHMEVSPCIPTEDDDWRDIEEGNAATSRTLGANAESLSGQTSAARRASLTAAAFAAVSSGALLPPPAP
jgi:dual specificity protein kinase YAK1